MSNSAAPIFHVINGEHISTFTPPLFDIRDVCNFVVSGAISVLTASPIPLMATWTDFALRVAGEAVGFPREATDKIRILVSIAFGFGAARGIF